VTTPDQAQSRFEPRFSLLVAAAIFLLAALTLMYPMLSGQIIGGSDQINVGYALRNFAATGMQQSGHIPQWNPFIFGGMPLWAVPGHFDVFYPTAWLRWFLSGDRVLVLALFIHLVVAGIAMYTLLRTLRASWSASVVAGLAYELSGILASQLSPGHDGKLFAAALVPFAFVALVRAIRHGRSANFGWFALVVGLVMLTPHYLAAYYMLVGSALFTLWLVFLDPERLRNRSPIVPLAMTAVAVAIGLGIAAVELLPVQHMVAYTPRAVGGDSGGYQYASSWGMSPVELMTVILPQFNGVLDNYWGPNLFKDHTEYLGALVVTLMVLGLPAARKRGLLLPLVGIGVLFMVVAWGGYTPLYHIWYLLPKMSQFRAPGLAFFMVALVTCVLAGFGVDALLTGEVKQRSLLTVLGVLGAVAILAAGGMFQGIAESLVSDPRVLSRAVGNAPELQAGGLRLLAVVLFGGGALVLVQRGMLHGAAAAAALVFVVGADNWSILRLFPKWAPPASVTFADDVLTTAMKKASPMPFRTYSPSAPELGQSQVNVLTVYKASALMARGVPTLLGYHGMESRFFDALLGGKNIWQNQFSPNLWDLYAVKYIIETQEPVGTPGFHKVLGPAQLDDLTGLDLAPGQELSAVVEQRDSTPRWVRVVPSAVKVPEEQIAPTVSADRFPFNTYALYPDSTSTKAAAPTSGMPTPEATPIIASLTSWQPGAMTVKLDGTDTRTTYLLVAENWYPDWHATIDGKPAPAYRADGALLSVELPPGAKEVTLNFDVATYHTGKMISLIALVLTVGLLFSDRLRPRTVHA
jgi:hypothetical protein